MKHRSTTLFSACLLACLLVPGATSVSAANKYALSLSEGLVSLDADGAGLKPLLQDLSQQSGFKLWMADNLPPRQISARFERQPLEQVLRRLLKNGSYALVLDDQSSISAIYILPPGEEQSEPPGIVLHNDSAEQIILQQFLESSSIAESIKQSLFEQFSVNQPVPGPEPAQALPAMNSIIQALEQIRLNIPQAEASGGNPP